KHSYNNKLENINTKLNPPTRSVNSEGFIPMLLKLDDCIEYVSSHANFKDHPVYLTKFQQCLSKAFHMKTHTGNTMQNLTSQLTKRDPLAVAPKVRMLIEQMEQRSERILEYHQLSEEIHQCYLDQREQLLSLIITATISDLTSQNNKYHYALVRCGFAFMFHVCQDEHQLYTDFFSKPTPRLEEVLELLEKLCLSLYDVLRLLIIHGIHLETMSELCGILNNEMLQDHVHNKNAGQLGVFEAVVKQMLEDVQERLVYRTHIYIQTDIIGYNPSPGDLAYPEKLESICLIRKQMYGNHHHAFFNVELFIHLRKFKITGRINYIEHLCGQRYPTVRRTLVCLSELYRCIDRAAFLGLSQEALSACIPLTIPKLLPNLVRTQVDGQLLAIKEISLDLKRTRDDAFKMMNPKSVPSFFRLYSPNAILECLLEGSPEIKEHYIDWEKDVDPHQDYSCCPCVRVMDFVLFQVSTLKTMVIQGGPTHNLSQQPWITINDIVMPTFRVMKSKLPSMLQSMSLYRANGDTEFILFKPVRNNIQQGFQRLHTVIQEGYSGEDLQIIACSSMEQASLVLIKLLLSVNK
uniref:Conserved oligomeric Golgi complex subunit 3 n=1 Tax=Oncorhynchus tshawytscha TaxID=74940 RepID=A0A8C8HXB3_ONCTS